MYACTQKQETVTKKVEIVSDTTQRGTLGKPNSYFEVHTKKGNIEIAWLDKLWDEKGRDSVGRYFLLMTDTYRKSYVWYDTIQTGMLGNRMNYADVLIIDSIFTKDKIKLKQIEYSFYTDIKNPAYPSLPQIRVTLYVRNNKVSSKQIQNFYTSKLFDETNGKFYIRDTSLPLGYSEWNEISRSYFGEALRDALIAKEFSLLKASQRDKYVRNHKIEFE